MIFIDNAIDPQNIRRKTNYARGQTYNILGLGTICKYHGYDRILKSIADCNGQLHDGRKIVFNIVGESNTIRQLREQALAMGLEQNVIFHGKKFTAELDEIFEKMDLAVGCIALYRRHANIDTTLKVVEYICRGMPYITSGISPMPGGLDSILGYKLSNDDHIIDFNEVDAYFSKLSKEAISEYADIAEQNLTWKQNVKKIIDVRNTYNG